MKKLRLILIFTLFFGALHSVFAQKIIVKGTVKDENGIGLIGATIAVKGTRVGVATGFDGKYEIGLDAGQTLVFSFVGTESQEFKITKPDNALNVVLRYEAEQLDDVVVMGYGSGKKIGTTIGSVAKVAGNELTNIPTPNVMDALQGRVAGLTINASSGKPGSAPIVLLHGLGTLIDVGNNGSDREINSTPLYIVDGLPVSNDFISSLNPDDFESVTVLKDASATSIYGARAAYGVIYITTKKGGFEHPTEVSVSSQIGFSQVSSRKFYENLLSASEYVDYMLDLGNLPDRDTADRILEYYKGDTRWDRIYFKPSSLTSQTNASVSGGGKKVSYYFSGSHFNQGGARHGSDYDRYSLRANIDSRINEWLSAGISFSVGNSISKSSPAEAGEGGGVLALPIYEAYDEDGKLRDYVDTFRGRQFFLPQYIASKDFATNSSTSIVPNFYVNIEPIKNLIFKSQAGLQYNISVSENKSLPSYILNAGVGRVSRSAGEGIYKTFTNTLEYKFRLLDNHLFTALLGQESVSNESKGFNATSVGQEIDGLTILGQGKQQITAFDNRSVSTYNSFFSRLDYSYDGRYYLDFSARRDGSSTFGKNNRYANFWAAGLMWNAKNEQFLKEVSWLNELRFKISTGTSGSKGGAGDYGSYSTLTFGRYNNEPTFLLENIGNPFLRWEKQEKTTIGFKLGLFDRVNLDVDFYQRTIKDMFFTEQLPRLTGFTSFNTNLAKLQNKGMDLTLNITAYQNKEKKALISAYVNMNYNEQKVLEVAQGQNVAPEYPFTIGYEEGSSLMLMAPIFKGVNPENGDPEWYVPGENRLSTVTDDNNITNRYNSVTLNQSTGKKAHAPVNGGFGLNTAYNGFSLRFDFSFSYGKYQVNSDRFSTESNAPFAFNVSKEARDFWKNPGDLTRNPRRGVQFVQEDSRLIEDASFIRLKNVNIGYSLPNEILETIPFFKNVRFFLSGRNLLTFTKYTGADPEFNVILSSGGYPNTRQFTFGTEIKF